MLLHERQELEEKEFNQRYFIGLEKTDLFDCPMELNEIEEAIELEAEMSAESRELTEQDVKRIIARHRASRLDYLEVPELECTTLEDIDFKGAA